MNSSTRIDRIGFAFTGRHVLTDREFFADSNTDDVLKFSQADVDLRGSCASYGGREEAMDVNNESVVRVQGVLRLINGDKAGAVIKGGSTLVTEGEGVIAFTPSALSRVDLLVDDWSDQSQARSTVRARVMRTDAQPVRYAWGRWRRPKLDGKTKVDWLLTIGLHFYNPFKALVRLFLRIPKGTKGPSWL